MHSFVIQSILCHEIQHVTFVCNVTYANKFYGKRKSSLCHSEWLTVKFEKNNMENRHPVLSFHCVKAIIYIAAII